MNKEKIKILMIDDDKEDFQIIEEVIKTIVHQKYSIDWTPSYTEGLKLIAQEQHDVYLVDYKLGAKTGLELIKKAIEQGCEAPLIILTGDNNVEIDRQALKAGASDYIVKGAVSAPIFERAVRYAIANADQRKELNRLNAELEERVKSRTLTLEQTLSELEKFQQELIESKNNAELAAKIAEEASKSKTHFLSSMSHEIRTPMNAILGFTKVVLDTDLTEKQREYLNAIKVSGDILIVLINDILDLAKVESGKMTFEKSPFKLSSCINEALQLSESTMDGQTFKLEKKYDPSIPEVLVGDKVRLHQIILNLLSNSIKFTSKGKITLGVRLLSEDEEKATIEFSVSDTGIGIPENKLNTIFEKFEQASDKTAKMYGGTGLGLSIVKQFVELQGGSISVKSKVNEGSTFAFTLRFEKTNAKEIKKEENKIPSKLKKEDVKILVAEDEPLNQLLIETIIEKFGFNLSIANNGKIASEMLQKDDYDLVLMDLHMPIMDGFEATAHIRSNVNTTIPIIALTADVTTVDINKCKGLGMTDYISKPIDEKLLYNTIVKYIQHPIPKKRKDQKKTPSLKKNCTNLDYLDSLTSGNLKGKIKLIKMYLEEIPGIVNNMKNSFNKMDWTGLRMATHKLIPSFSLMGINQDFEESARKIERFAIEKKNADEIKGLIEKIDAVCSRACEELKMVIKKM